MVTCTGHIGIHEGADGRTYVRTENDVMAILPNFLPSMGYQYFLSYGAPRARLQRALSKNKLLNFPYLLSLASSGFKALSPFLSPK